MNPATNSSNPVDETTELGLEALNRLLDRTKSAVFLSKHAAFFGSLMCSLNFQWSREISTAATDSVNLFWNPDWFLKLPPRTRETVLLHELWHVARLHHPRQGTRDPKRWNIACDFRINNDLLQEGASFIGAEGCCIDLDLDANGIMSEEDIYDQLPLNPQAPNDGGWGDKKGDMLPQTTDGTVNQQVINNVVRAIQQAKLAGGAGTIPGGVEDTVSQFLEPQIPWRSVLMQFFTDRLHDDFTWKRPNRRYPSIYLPSRFQDEGRLEHLAYYLDVSGSITEHDVRVFSSEVKYIQETLQPERLTLVQFDTRITSVQEFKESDPFDGIEIIGRGGTSLEPVKEHIEKIRPTAAIIFSDLQVPAMQPLACDTPVIWATTSKHPRVNFGKIVRIV